MANLGIVGLSVDLLLGSFQARSALSNARTAPAQTLANTALPDTSVPPPWDPASRPPGLEETLRNGLARGVFFENDLGRFSDSSAPLDQQKLFALYSGVNRLAALATEASDRTVTDSTRSFLNKNLTNGLTQLSDFLSATEFEDLGFVQGKGLTKAQSESTISRGLSEFTTGVIHDGEFDAPVDGFLGDVRISITAKKFSGDITVNIDLADLGATPRTLDNVAEHINAELTAAGIITQVKREKIGEPDENGIIAGSRFGFKFSGTSTETLDFSAPDATPSIYTVGNTGLGDTLATQFSRFNTVEGAAPETVFSKRLEAADGVGGTADAQAAVRKSLAVATGANGEVFVVSEASAEVSGLNPRGEQDVFLTKFDSQGNEVFSRALGAAGTASGLALSVGADGAVVVAGKISGGFGTTIDVGGDDAFAVKYDADGSEVFAQRFGGLLNEEVSSVAIGDDGTVFLAGRTTSTLEGTRGGGEDGFIRALDANGTTLYTRQFGGAGDERAKAIALDANGDLLVASEEDGVGVLRKFSSADGTSPAVYEFSVGDLGNGQLNAITFDGDGILLAGTAGEGNALGAAVNAHSGADDGFVVRIDEDIGGQPSRSFTTFLGTAGSDRIRGAQTLNGQLYVAGSTTGSLPGGGTLNGTENAFTAVLDASTGALTGSVQVAGGGGFSSAQAIAIDPLGNSSLDAFGLPRGEILFSDSRVIADRTTARAGDNFFISIDGGAKRKITIDDNDDLRALALKINTVLVPAGNADVRRTDNGDALVITPQEGRSFELSAGSEGQDLLRALGLPEGAVKLEEPEDEDGTKAIPVHSLGIGSALDLSTLNSATAASEALEEALATIRSAYRTLTQDPALTDLLNGNNAALNGPVPEHLRSQIANYSAGLARLQSGGGGGTIV